MSGLRIRAGNCTLPLPSYFGVQASAAERKLVTISTMKHVSRLVALAGSISLVALGASLVEPRATDAAAAPRLEAIKALAGDWIAAEQASAPDAPVQSSIRVTAGGSAVLETLFPGTDHEMITVYHTDGEDLVLTHYCVAGNQPRYKARAGEAENQLVYECQGGSNIRTADDAHMHEGMLTIVDADHIRTSWRMYEKGEIVHTAEFDLVRVRRP